MKIIGCGVMKEEYCLRGLDVVKRDMRGTRGAAAGDMATAYGSRGGKASRKEGGIVAVIAVVAAGGE